VKNSPVKSARISGFEGLPENDREKILDISQVKRYRKGETVFMEGEVAEGFFVALKGKVKVFKLSREGREAILHICGPGDHFGHAALHGSKTFPACAETLENSEILHIPREGFVELLAKEPSIALDLFEVLSERLRELTVQVENLALKEVPGRLASYILSLSVKQGGAEDVSLGFSKTQLASILGTTPETLSRMLSDFSSRGYIKENRGAIHIIDHPGLQNLAEQGRFTD
jgi:CRP/FNR family transcriptional regulator